MTNSSNQSDILIVGAHPDDAEMAMGGTMLLLARAGYSIHHLVMTPSQMSTYGDTKTRRKEFEASCSFISCSGEILDFCDSKLKNNDQTREAVNRVLRNHKPKIVFAPYHTNNFADRGGIANVDHAECGSIVRDAVKLARLDKTIPELEPHTVGKTFFYMLPRQVNPSIWVDVSAVIDQTIELINSYQSQMAINFMGNSIEEILRTKKASAGIEIGVKYAETFSTDLPLLFKPNTFFEL